MVPQHRKTGNKRRQQGMEIEVAPWQQNYTAIKAGRTWTWMGNDVLCAPFAQLVQLGCIVQQLAHTQTFHM
jgi:hypothetical protein